MFPISGALILEKECISQLQFSQEPFRPSNLTFDGCAEYSGGLVRYCTCRTDYCNGLSMEEARATTTEKAQAMTTKITAGSQTPIEAVTLIFGAHFLCLLIKTAT